MKKTTVLILALFSVISFSGAQVLPKDSLFNEFRYFTKLLEETHPDPYTEFGGKVEFHKRAFEIGQQLKNEEYTIDEYSSLLSSFLSNLRDGHSFIVSQNVENKAVKYIPLGLKTIQGGIIITGIPSAYSRFLGTRVIEMNNLPVDSICKELSILKPSENKYGEYNLLVALSFNPAWVGRIFPGMESEISLSVLTADDNREDFILPLTEKAIWDNKDIAQVPIWNKMPFGEYLYYKPIDKNMAYLRMKSVMSRENFIAIQRQKWPSLEKQLKSFYQQILRQEMPKDIDEAIAGIPCFAEIFRNMLLEMRKNNTENLIIDLRYNGGGWTPITLPALYMMYGDKYLDTDMATNYYRMFSPLYMKKLGTTLEDFNKDNNSDYRYGEYSFNKSSGKNLTQEEKRKQFIENTIGNGGDYIKDLDGKPIYTPAKIYVLTDAGTFSAAFHYAFYLWKMGAVVAGIPSAQAPNTFMEITEFELPYTKTKGSISNSVQYFLPPTDKRAKTFWPDMMPEYKDYKKYNFDQDAELLWLLDRINNR